AVPVVKKGDKVKVGQLIAVGEAFISANIHSSVSGTVEKIDDYIRAGDCYQVNYAQRFSAPFEGDLWEAYLLLRASAPTPYAGYLECSQGSLLSLSPECFLTVKNRTVLTKPIKGTCPRGDNNTSDKALANQLLSSTKDRAENLMIVDLLRNDLSKECTLGSVKVPHLFALESYKNVHHLVSTIEGTLPESTSPLALLKSCFPGGSITGAPKIRAMEIIEELEPHRRSAYCGSLGYISFCGNMNTNITIRTLVGTLDKLYCWAGGGIVADSIIQHEYDETFTKVSNLLDCLNSTYQQPDSH
ncbi:MAG: aminodeoxychorismate synthase component I, partial [Pontibacterium sp.]